MIWHWKSSNDVLTDLCWYSEKKKRCGRKNWHGKKNEIMEEQDNHSGDILLRVAPDKALRNTQHAFVFLIAVVVSGIVFQTLEQWRRQELVTTGAQPVHIHRHQGTWMINYYIFTFTTGAQPFSLGHRPLSRAAPVQELDRLGLVTPASAQDRQQKQGPKHLPETLNDNLSVNQCQLTSTSQLALATTRTWHRMNKDEIYQFTIHSKYSPIAIRTTNYTLIINVHNIHSRQTAPLQAQ